jgi:hypothetical protein
MIRLSTVFLCFVLVTGCKNETRDKEELKTTPPVAQWFETDTLVVWNCDAASQQRTRIFFPADSVPLVQPFLNGINKTWPEVQLVKKEQRQDTLVVAVYNSSWLSNRSGDSGPEQYMAFAALNLLEIKGVQVVQFDFEAGVHARPGNWTAADFADWKTVIPQQNN